MVMFMDKEIKLFIDYLRQKNLKLTEQRKNLLKTFLNTKRHISAEELYDVVRKKDPNIGYATVFRTLKILHDAGIAKKLTLGDGRARYENKYGQAHHDHLICVKCGRVIETVHPKIEKLQKELCARHNFLPERHKMEIYGICDRCR